MAPRNTLVLLACCALPGARAACEHMPWLEQYVRFHAEQRGNASAPTLTVWKRGHQWGGHGDVFRHFLWALRFAAATRRVYYISAENPPLPLTEIMSPGAIAWTVPDELRRAAPALPNIDSLTLAQRKPPAFGEPGFAQHLLTDCGEYCNVADQEVWRNNTERELDISAIAGSPDCPCMWAALFTPSPRTLAASRRPYDAPYTGIHIRSAGLLGELTGVERGDTVRMLIGSLHCASALRQPVYLAASDFAIRRAVAGGVFPRVAGAAAPWARHSARDGDSSPAQHFETVAELAALAGASCLILSNSGFGNIAAWWGGQTCVRHVGRTGLVWAGPPRNAIVDAKPTHAECFDQLLQSARDPDALQKAVDAFGAALVASREIEDLAQLYAVAKEAAGSDLLL